MNLSTRESKTGTATIAEARKFLFDLSFDDEVAMAAPRKEKEKPTFSEEDLKAAQKEAYNSGMAAGKNAMQESQQQQMNQILASLESKMKEVMNQAHDLHTQQLAQMRQISLVIMRKIMPAYVAQYGLEEIETIAARTLSEMNQEPRLVIRVSDTQFEEAQKRITAISEKQAYEGKLVIMGDPDLSPSDCRIEWADGGIERDIRQTWHEIDRILGMETNLLDEETPTTPTEQTAETASPAEENHPHEAEQKAENQTTEEPPL